MYEDLLNRLETKIQEAVDTIEIYRRENAELKERNAELENQHHLWEEKLNSLINKFETLDQEEAPQAPEEPASDSPSYLSENATEDRQEENVSEEKHETSPFSSTSTFGNQAVASSYPYTSRED